MEAHMDNQSGDLDPIQAAIAAGAITNRPHPRKLFPEAAPPTPVEKSVFETESISGTRKLFSRSSKKGIMNRGRMEYAAYFSPPKRSSTIKTDRRSIRSFFSRFDRDLVEVRPMSRPMSTPVDQESQRTGTAGGTLSVVNESECAKSNNLRPKRRSFLIHVVLGLFFTGWWITSLVLHRDDKNWVVPFLLWLAIMIRLVTFYIYIGGLMIIPCFLWWNTVSRTANLIPEGFRLVLGAIFVTIIIIVGAMVSPEFEDNTRANRAVSLCGLATFLLILWATSRNRKMVNWQTVIVGILLQFLLALFVLRTSFGSNIVTWISDIARILLGFATSGLVFVTDGPTSSLPWIVISDVPPIILFAGIAQLLIYWDIVLWFVNKAAIIFHWALQISGAEAIVAITSPFLGITQAVMLVRPFLPHITHSELHQIMCSGFASIGGSMLVTYIILGVNVQALISSCVMSIPASIVVSKLRYPEEEDPLTVRCIAVDERNDGVNAIQAFTNGAWLGLKIAGIVISMLLSVIALVAILDALLTWWGSYINLFPNTPLTLELIMSYLLYPIVFLLGVPRNGDLLKVSRLIGIKIIKSELLAFQALQTDPLYSSLSNRSRLIATYALAGFGNLGWLGAQVGLLIQIVPERSADVAKAAVSAFISGVISTLLSGCMAGLLVVDERAGIFVGAVVNGTIAG
ncbi:Na+ dependent nucleoside transporter C-terminus-domain-containing protein [Halenospora varia]|nr:Na+ dependent nucleoside transporter C-terminus-domain-containing protein [Halenospora varia]